MEHDIVLRIRKIQGKSNKLTDCLSRLDRPFNTEWSLDQTVANSTFQMLNFPNQDCGFVCDPIQSQTPIVCISSYGQSSISNRYIINELETFTCICIFTNNSDTIYSSQDMWTSVQNSRYCSSLASTSLVLRGVTTTSISSDSSSVPSKNTNSTKRNIPTLQHLPLLELHAWELSNNQLWDKNNSQILPQNQYKHLFRKSMMQNGSYTPIRVIDRRLIQSRPLLQL